MLARLQTLGISWNDALTLRRISMTLHRWSEMECGGGNGYASWSIERDETTHKPYMVSHPYNGSSRRRAVADRETGALKRLAALMSKYPLLVSYHQTDPRGCALYIVHENQLVDVHGEKDFPIEQVYNRGVAVHA